MNEEFDRILDDCVNRINSGERLEDCLVSYQDNAAELEPLLRTVVDVQAPLKFTPSAQVKSAAKRHFNSVIERSHSNRERRRPLFNMLPRWSAAVAAAAAVLLVVLASYFAMRPAGVPGGPAGLAAGLYAARSRLKVLLLGDVAAGGYM